MIRTQTEQLLELFSRTLNFLRLIDVIISLHITVLIVRGCFDRMHRFKKIIFAPDARALLPRNYDKLSHIFFYAYYLYIITDFSPAVWNK